MPMSFTIWFLMAAIFFALLPALVVLPIINRVAKVHNISPLLTRVGTEMASYPGAPLTHDGIPRVTKSLRTTYECLQTFTQKNCPSTCWIELVGLVGFLLGSPSFAQDHRQHSAAVTRFPAACAIHHQRPSNVRSLSQQSRTKIRVARERGTKQG